MGAFDAWLDLGKSLLGKVLPGTAAELANIPAPKPAISVTKPASPARDAKAVWVVGSEMLSKHISLMDMTRTDHADLQKENRKVTDEEVATLSLVAAMLEVFWGVLGPLDIHSGKRGEAVNTRVGGSDKSQHLKCEAVDFSPAGPDTESSIEAAFAKLLAAAKEGKFKFGQLIVESQAKGREGRVYWLHASLGAPYRNVARCGEVLRMKDGKYESVARIAQGAA